MIFNGDGEGLLAVTFPSGAGRKRGVLALRCVAPACLARASVLLDTAAGARLGT